MVFCLDKELGLKVIIVVYNIKLGLVVGGCRMWDYIIDEDVVIDVFCLLKGMMYKNVVVCLLFGGGKLVIIGNVKEIKLE